MPLGADDGEGNYPTTLSDEAYRNYYAITLNDEAYRNYDPIPVNDRRSHTSK